MIEAHEQLQTVLDSFFRGRDRLRVLDAGCGAGRHVTLKHAASVVGLDISQDQLARNTSVDEKILGDVQTYPLPEAEFDLAVCWDLLEHLPNPRRALTNMVRALKPGGALVLAVPNATSLKGLVTRFTPYFVHAFFYRWVIGDRRENGFAQFPTYLRSAISPVALVRFAKGHGLSVPFMRLYEGPVQHVMRRRYRVADAAFRVLGAASRAMTGGRVDLNHSDVLVVLQKPQAQEHRP